MSFFRKTGIIKDQKAQAMVEFMIVFPVVLILICGAFEFSMLSLIHQNVNYASFCGARAETVGKDARFSVIVRMLAAMPHSINSLNPGDAIEIVMGGSGSGSDMDYLKRDDFYPWLENIMKEIFPTETFHTILETVGGLVKDDELGIPESVKGFTFLFYNIPQAIMGIISSFTDMDGGFWGFVGSALDAGESAYSNITADVEDPFDKTFYKQLSVIRKAIYALLLTEVDVTEDNSNENAPALKVSVTYYYNLKFPIIRTLFKYVLKSTADSGPDVFSGSGAKWTKAEAFSRISDSVFVPITHSTLIGNEQKMA